MKKLLEYILARAGERSTWIGLVSIATALGVALSPAQRDATVALGIALAGFIAAITKDPA